MSAIEATFQRGIDKELTNTGKILIGGVGALAPILLNLLVVEPKTIFASVTTGVVFGYLIRVVGFFCLGGFIAYLHKSEKNPIRLFELGIVAPAILTGMLNGQNVKNPNVRASNEPPAATAGVMDLIIPTAHAQDNEPEIKTYEQDSLSNQVWRGLSGRQNENVWFVVAGTYKHSKLADARELVKKIDQRGAGYHPKIYKNDEYYAVVIGANLTFDQAKVFKEKAVEAKVPTYGEIYLYNPWELK